jgi:uncharacterized membrane protein
VELASAVAAVAVVLVWVLAAVVVAPVPAVAVPVPVSHKVSVGELPEISLWLLEVLFSNHYRHLSPLFHDQPRPGMLRQ